MVPNILRTCLLLVVNYKKISHVDFIVCRVHQRSAKVCACTCAMSSLYPVFFRSPAKLHSVFATLTVPSIIPYI